MADPKAEQSIQDLVSETLDSDGEAASEHSEEDMDDSDENDTYEFASEEEVTGHCYLLDLPSELRNRIWNLSIRPTTYVQLKDPDPWAMYESEDSSDENENKIREPAITATCRQIREESLDMFYSTVVLRVKPANEWVDEDPDHFDPSMMPETAINYKRALQIARLLKHAKAFEVEAAFEDPVAVYRLDKNSGGANFGIKAHRMRGKNRRRYAPIHYIDRGRPDPSKIRWVREFLEEKGPPPGDRFVMTPDKLNEIVKLLVKSTWEKEMEELTYCPSLGDTASDEDETTDSDNDIANNEEDAPSSEDAAATKEMETMFE